MKVNMPNCKDKRGYLRVLLVLKRSRLEVYRHKRLMSRLSGMRKSHLQTVEIVEKSHEVHKACFESIKGILEKQKVVLTLCKRSELEQNLTKGHLVITVGGDGTALDASHYIKNGALLGVNSDPDNSVGLLCATDQTHFSETLERIMEGDMPYLLSPRIGGSINGQKLPFLALNEILVAHENPAMTTRYWLAYKDFSEGHKNSGLWISTAIGSTAAIASAGGTVQALEDDRLQAFVREPYFFPQGAPLRGHFFISPSDSLQIVSQMSAGRIYIDGPFKSVPFSLGDQLVVKTHLHSLCLFRHPQLEERRAGIREKLASYERKRIC